MRQDSMTPGERRIAVSMAGIFSARMLGLFMIVPVFVEYAKELTGYTATLAGLAIGIYGLSQALLQIPLGMLSDRIGRKPVIIGGLLVFALGSVVAALSTSMSGVILGRALQGAGAIGAAVLALTADLTREEQRVKVMAFIGISIGISFALAMVLGPLLHRWLGLAGLFWLIGALALVAIGIVTLRVPTPAVRRFHRDTEVEIGWLRQALGNRQLLRLDFGIFTLHAILMATFVVVPGMLHAQPGLAEGQDWLVYLPTMVLGMALIIPFIILAEKKRILKPVLAGAVTVLILAELGLAGLGGSMAGMVIMLLLFFAAFNLLEAMLPSLVARLAPAAHKGTAMGVYSSSQFLGIFAGGTVGGWLLEYYGVAAVFLASAALAAAWLLLAVTMQKPGYLSTKLLNVGTLDQARARQVAEELSRVAGVEEATVIAADGVAYLKVDKQRLDA
ncbi:MAG TPA: MFS transporter, partial [Chromatiales bacterium]|nr:MFS transporter [Chromatiales bacterium]